MLCWLYRQNDSTFTEVNQYVPSFIRKGQLDLHRWDKTSGSAIGKHLIKLELGLYCSVWTSFRKLHPTYQHETKRPPLGQEKAWLCGTDVLINRYACLDIFFRRVYFLSISIFFFVISVPKNFVHLPQSRSDKWDMKLVTSFQFFFHFVVSVFRFFV